MNDWKRKFLLSFVVLGLSVFYSIAPATDGAAQWRVIWDELHPPVMPPAEFVGACMAYDVKREVVVLFAGTEFGAVWEWDGQSWTEHRISTSEGPTHCVRDGMLFDPIRESIIASGPFSAELSGTAPLTEIGLWEWDGRAWTLQALGDEVSAPASRLVHAMAVDYSSGEILLHGGFLWNLDAYPDLNEDCVSGFTLYDTWLLSRERTHWTEPTPSCETPSGQRTETGFADSLMVYDNRSSRVVLLRILKDSTFDTWTWNESEWSEVQEPESSLSDFIPLALLYHSKREVPLKFGVFLDSEPPRLDALFFHDDQWHLLEARDRQQPATIWERLRKQQDAEIGVFDINISYAYDSKRDEVILLGATDDGDSAMWSARLEEVSSGSRFPNAPGCACS